MLWVKAFHIIAMVCWFAGIFYLPRLFVYHALCEDEISNARFKIMERRLYRGIMNPSAILTIFLGLWLVHYNPSYYAHAAWFHAKLSCVLLILIYHWLCGHFIRKFSQDANRHSHIFYRVFNEVPILMLIAIVILVVVKPF